MNCELDDSMIDGCTGSGMGDDSLCEEERSSVGEGGSYGMGNGGSSSMGEGGSSSMEEGGSSSVMDGGGSEAELEGDNNVRDEGGRRMVVQVVVLWEVKMQVTEEEAKDTGAVEQDDEVYNL